jgi:hypothetical protein
MGTPLEDYIDNITSSNKSLVLDQRRLAIGSDNDFSTELRDGIKWLGSVSQQVDDFEEDCIIIPQCYSYYLKLTGAKWNEQGNINWISATVSGENKPLVCHVFHEKIAECLVQMNSPIDGSKFDKKYVGKKRYTFKEVMTVLSAGYTKLTHLGHPGHVMLWR